MSRSKDRIGLAPGEAPRRDYGRIAALAGLSALAVALVGVGAALAVNLFFPSLLTPQADEQTQQAAARAASEVVSDEENFNAGGDAQEGGDVPGLDDADKVVVATPDPDENPETGDGEDESTENDDKDPADGKNTSSACSHEWEPIYKTIHHKAKYRKIRHAATYKTEKSTETVCTVCKGDDGNPLIVTGKAKAHTKKTGHECMDGATFVREVVDKAAYTEKKLVKAAYDEQVADGEKCSKCGKTRKK